MVRIPSGIPDKQVAMLIATKSLARKSCFLERGLDIEPSKAACSRADQAGLLMLERVLEPSVAVDKGSFFSDGCSK